MKTAVVTGAGGFIGGALTAALLSRGYRVYGIDLVRESMSRFFTDGHFIGVGINLENEKLSNHIDESVDVIYHLAWGGSLGGSDLYNAKLQAENISTSIELCEDMVDKCKRFIFCGSSYEYMRENGNVDIPINIYGIAKGTAASICGALMYRNRKNFNKVILTNTFGIGDRSKKAVNTLIYKMLRREKLSLVEGDKPNDWMFIDDTVEGLIKVFEEGVPYKDYYIGNKNISTFKEKISIMAELLYPEAELEFGTMHENTYVDYAQLDLNALYEDTTFSPKTDFRKAILKTAEWVKQLEW